MSWFFFAILDVVALSFANILQKVLMKEETSNALSYSVFYLFLGTIMAGAFSLVYGFTLPPIFDYPLLYFAGGASYGVGLLCLFKALQKLSSSEVTILTSVRAVITIVIAVIVLNESFSLWKVVGTIFILLAVFLTSKKPGEKFEWNEGVLFSLAMAFFYGISIVIDKFLLRTAEPISYTVIMFLIPGLTLVILRPKVVVQLGTFLQPKVLKPMLIMSFLSVLAAFSFFLALDLGANASQMSPINQGSVILTVLLAALFLKETQRLPIKLLSAVLVVIGVVLLR